MDNEELLIHIKSFKFNDLQEWGFISFKDILLSRIHDLEEKNLNLNQQIKELKREIKKLKKDK